MIDAFIGHYAYSTGLDVSQRQLEATKQKPDESFAEFLMKSRKKVVFMIQ